MKEGLYFEDFEGVDARSRHPVARGHACVWLFNSSVGV